jgi:precorrin-4 methylase
MILKAKNLSQNQKIAIESLLGRAVAEDESISIRAVTIDECGVFTNANSVAAPEWLQNSWKNAKLLGLDRLSLEEIDAEIKAARKVRPNPR